MTNGERMPRSAHPLPYLPPRAARRMFGIAQTTGTVRA